MGRKRSSEDKKLKSLVGVIPKVPVEKDKEVVREAVSEHFEKKEKEQEEQPMKLDEIKDFIEKTELKIPEKDLQKKVKIQAVNFETGKEEQVTLTLKELLDLVEYAYRKSIEISLENAKELIDSEIYDYRVLEHKKLEKAKEEIDKAEKLLAVYSLFARAKLG
jgi:hypothetical protein